MQVGFVTLLLILEPVVTEELKFNFNQVLGRNYTLPRVITSGSNNALPPSPDELLSPTPQQSGFGNLIMGGSEIITPVSTDFGIVIEKINANARVVPNVNPANEKEYMQALSQGVAHAKGTALPGRKGNIYLFSHSTDAPWNIVRYNAIFFLLNKLESDDRVILFYQGRRFDYIVFDKVIAGASETHYLTHQYEDSVLTLQTCDPPGTTINRLIVRAKLAGS